MSKVFQRVFILLVIFQYAHQQPKIEFQKEKEEVLLNCDPPNKGNLISWFRIREDNFEFLVAVTSNNEVKLNKYPDIFKTGKINRNILTLTEFQKTRDSGIYCCSSFNKNMLNFGKATHIQGNPEARPTTKTTAAATAAIPALPALPDNSACSPDPCSCNSPMDTKMVHPKIKCELMIFAPLAGGCGMLLLILIITIGYFTRMKTKRCPHHYKRTPKNPAPVRQARPDRYV